MTLRNRLSLVLTCAILFSPLASSNFAFAAPGQQSHQEEHADGEDANSFKDRIQRILDEYAKPNSRTNDRASAKLASGKPKEEEYIETIPSEEMAGRPADAYTPSVTMRETYDFDWQGTPIASSLYAVAKIAGKNVVVNGKLDGTVYVSLRGVTYQQALDYLSRSFGFNWMIEGNDIICSTSDIMLQSRVFQVDYADKEKIKEEFKAIGLDDSRIYANLESGTVSVTGTPYQIKECEKRLRAIDHPVSQCLILAQLIEINHGKSLNLGMQYSLPTYSHVASTGSESGSSLGGNFLEKLTFAASATASRELSKGKVIARPMVMIMNGQEGTVNMGDRVPVMSTTSTASSTNVTVSYENIGTTLKVTPIINERTSEISMKIHCEVSNITKWISQGQTSAPQVATRSADTSAHLKSGQSFVIGGLMSVSDLDNLSGIPGLMDLPILGSLFRFHSRSKTYAEVYIMITPYIVTADIDPQQLLRTAGGDGYGGR